MPAATSERTCTAEGCDGRHLALGFCQYHYYRDYQRRRKEQAASGAWPKDRAARRTVEAPAADQCPLVRAAAVRAHLTDLAAVGLSPATVRALAGVPYAPFAAVTSGAEYVRRDYALAVMRIHADPMLADDRAMISAHGAQRRVQALIALGWQFGEIAGWLGFHQSMLSNLIHPATRTVSGRHHRQIAEMYQQRMLTVPRVKHPKALGRARREGWVTPLAWDDIDRDVKPPTVLRDKERPDFDEIAVELALDGVKVPLRRADKVEVVTRAHALRWSDQTISRVTGIIDKTAFRIRQDLGLPGWEMHELRDTMRGR